MILAGYFLANSDRSTHLLRHKIGLTLWESIYFDVSELNGSSIIFFLELSFYLDFQLWYCLVSLINSDGSIHLPPHMTGLIFYKAYILTRVS